MTRKIVGSYSEEKIGSILTQKMTDSFQNEATVAFRILREANEEEWRDQVIRNGGYIPVRDRTGAKYYEIEILD